MNRSQLFVVGLGVHQSIKLVRDGFQGGRPPELLVRCGLRILGRVLVAMFLVVHGSDVGEQGSMSDGRA